MSRRLKLAASDTGAGYVEYGVCVCAVVLGCLVAYKRAGLEVERDIRLAGDVVEEMSSEVFGSAGDGSGEGSDGAGGAGGERGPGGGLDGAGGPGGGSADEGRPPTLTSGGFRPFDVDYEELFGGQSAGLDSKTLEEYGPELEAYDGMEDGPEKYAKTVEVIRGFSESERRRQRASDA